MTATSRKDYRIIPHVGFNNSIRYQIQEKYFKFFWKDVGSYFLNKGKAEDFLGEIIKAKNECNI